MIYILGSSLSVDKLPLHDTLEYSVVTDTTKMTGILGMGIRKSDVARCYVHSSVECKRIAAGSEDKIVRFSSDEELLSLLSGSTAENSKTAEPDSEHPRELVEEHQTTADDIKVIQRKIDSITPQDKHDADKMPEQLNRVEKDDLSNVEEVKVENVISTAADDAFEADVLRQRLATTEAILRQNRACLEEVKKDRDEVYTYAMKQIEDIQNEYEEKLKVAQDACESLREQLLAASSGPLSDFEIYVKRNRARIQAGLTIDNPPRNLIVIAPGSVESAKSLYQSLAILSLSGAFTGSIIDFTGDMSFATVLQNLSKRLKNMELAAQGRPPMMDFPELRIDMQSRDLVNYIRDNTIDLYSQAVTQFGNCKVIFSGFYHDISLLTFDWHKFIRDAANPEVIGKAPVITLLPVINSFAPRYALSYLSAGIYGCVATTCSPIELNATKNNLSSTEEHRVKVLALNYSSDPRTDSILAERSTNSLASRFDIKPFAPNKFFFAPEPTIELFRQDVFNNSKIWAEAFRNK